MITYNGTEIRQSDDRHKFSSAMAEYLYEVMRMGDEDESVGNSTDGPGILIRVGRRVLLEQPSGFVCEERLPFGPDDGRAMPVDARFDRWVRENYPEIYYWDEMEGEEGEEGEDYGTAEERVAHGADVLDLHFPDVDWRRMIDLDRLDVSDPRNCILGQLFFNYIEGASTVGSVVDCGFCEDLGTVLYSDLDRAWRNLLTTEDD